MVGAGANSASEDAERISPSTTLFASCSTAPNLSTPIDGASIAAGASVAGGCVAAAAPHAASTINETKTGNTNRTERDFIFPPMNVLTHGLQCHALWVNESYLPF